MSKLENFKKVKGLENMCYQDEKINMANHIKSRRFNKSGLQRMFYNFFL